MARRAAIMASTRSGLTRRTMVPWTLPLGSWLEALEAMYPSWTATALVTAAEASRKDLTSRVMEPRRMILRSPRVEEEPPLGSPGRAGEMPGAGGVAPAPAPWAIG